MIKQLLKEYPRLYRQLAVIYWATPTRIHEFNRVFVRATTRTRGLLLTFRLNRAVKKFPKDKTIILVQVGSNDGVEGDPVRHLILSNDNWRAVFIEPVKHIFERLAQNYENSERFIFENIAIGTESGFADFYYVSGDAKYSREGNFPRWYDQLGSFNRQHILNIDERLEPYIVCEKLKCARLSDVLQTNGLDRIDFLHIDTEGFDYHVLAQVEFSKYKPLIVLYEHVHLSLVDQERAEVLLTENGYKFRRYGSDTLAILSEKPSADSRQVT